MSREIINGVEFESEAMKVGEVLKPVTDISFGVEKWLARDIENVLKRIREKSVVAISNTQLESEANWLSTRPERNTTYTTNIWHHDFDRAALILRCDTDREEKTRFVKRKTLLAGMIEKKDILFDSSDPKIQSFYRRLTSLDPRDIGPIVSDIYNYYVKVSIALESRTLIERFYASVDELADSEVLKWSWVGRKGYSLIMDNSVSSGEGGECALMHSRMPGSDSDKGGFTRKASVVYKGGKYQLDRYDS